MLFMVWMDTTFFFALKALFFHSLAALPFESLFSLLCHATSRVHFYCTLMHDFLSSYNHWAYPQSNLNLIHPQVVVPHLYQALNFRKLQRHEPAFEISYWFQVENCILNLQSFYALRCADANTGATTFLAHKAVHFY